MFHESHPFRRSAQGTERLFFALIPPQRLAFSIAARAGEDLGEEWRLQRPDRLHVTLAITNDFAHCPFDVMDAMLRAGEMVQAAPFPIELDRLVLSNRSAALRPSHANPGLKALQGAIAHAMMTLGVPMREEWRFSPHMTLGYRDGRPAQHRVETRRWEVGEFALIRSLVGRTRHLPLGRWALSGPAVGQYELF